MLFPVVSDSSKEGKAVSIFLSCLEHVSDYGRLLLSELGVRTHSRTTVETWTEVNLKKCGPKVLRPDGLIVVRNGEMKWSALIEAKIGLAELTAEQVEAYLDLAKMNGIDALITISNQFSPFPKHYPITLSPSAAKKASLLHWSWTELLTKAEVLLAQEPLRDPIQNQVLTQFTRFLGNPASGVQGYDLMPAAWSDLAGMIQSRSPITPRSIEVQDVVAAWHQKTQDLCCRLSRRFQQKVSVKIPKAHAADAFERVRSDIAELVATHCVQSDFSVPGLASAVSVTCDFGKRALYFAMELDAPEDRKSTKARVNWLLRQLERSKPDNLHIRVHWPGKTPFTQFSLAALREAPERAEQPSRVATRFEVILALDLGLRFTKRKNFNGELESIFGFHDEVGRYLKAWQPPKTRVERTDGVATEAREREAAVSAEVVAELTELSEASVEGADEATVVSVVPSPETWSFVEERHTERQRQVLERIASAIPEALIQAPTDHVARRLRDFRLPELLHAQAASLASRRA
jgi:hypothetical protein